MTIREVKVEWEHVTEGYKDIKTSHPWSSCCPVHTALRPLLVPGAVFYIHEDSIVFVVDGRKSNHINLPTDMVLWIAAVDEATADGKLEEMKDKFFPRVFHIDLPAQYLL